MVRRYVNLYDWIDGGRQLSVRLFAGRVSVIAKMRDYEKRAGFKPAVNLNKLSKGE